MLWTVPVVWLRFAATHLWISSNGQLRVVPTA